MAGLGRRFDVTNSGRSNAREGPALFVALRDIVRDEELTFDYAMTDDEDYVLKCNCRTASCRVTITGRDWRNTETQQKYDGYFAWYIQRRIDAHKRFGPDSPGENVSL